MFLLSLSKHCFYSVISLFAVCLVLLGTVCDVTGNTFYSVKMYTKWTPFHTVIFTIQNLSRSKIQYYAPLLVFHKRLLRDESSIILWFWCYKNSSDWIDSNVEFGFESDVTGHWSYLNLKQVNDRLEYVKDNDLWRCKYYSAYNSSVSKTKINGV